MDLGISGRSALVMGASSGLGEAIAQALTDEGARVTIASRSDEKLRAARERNPAIQAHLTVDTADLDAVRALPASVGDVDILITNTGGPPPGDALDHDVETWERAYRSLVLAPRVLIEAFVPKMRERRWGRIVNVGSSATIEPIPGLDLSTVHRLATVGLFKALATSLAPDGITLNTVATGLFATERLTSLAGSAEKAQERGRQTVPARRLGTPAEYGAAVAFLCSEQAGYLTGVVLPLDGGAVKRVS